MLNYFLSFLILFILNTAGGESNMKIKVESPAFENGREIPVKYTCDGEDVSPEIIWSNIPEGTKSLVLIMDDPDAPMGTFTHWVVYDIPPRLHHLPEDLPKVAEIETLKQGINDFRNVGYGGPCPPPGKPHRYFFKVYALDVSSLGIPAGMTRKIVEDSMKGHILGEGYLMGLYGR
jgi:hypothetical protein